jgi:hypothetical protein
VNGFDESVRVEMFPVKVESGEILIDVPETGAEAPVAG